MKITAYRITQTKYLKSAFDGEGARLYGGRWNSAGTPVVYLASSVSLATLEVLVHTDDVAMLEGRYSVVPVHFEEALVKHITPPELPPNWSSGKPLPATQSFGDKWVARGDSLLLAVPSAVTRNEVNYLLNPRHPDFPQIEYDEAFGFRLDPRLH